MTEDRLRDHDMYGHKITPVGKGFGISVSVGITNDGKGHAMATLFHESDGFRQALMSVNEEGPLNVFYDRYEEVMGYVFGNPNSCSDSSLHFRPALTRAGKWMTSYTGDDGFPDIIAAKAGRLLVLECKGTRGAKKPKPTAKGSELTRLIRWEQQEAWLEAFAPMSELSQFVTPDNLDDVLQEIAR